MINFEGHGDIHGHRDGTSKQTFNVNIKLDFPSTDQKATSLSHSLSLSHQCKRILKRSSFVPLTCLDISEIRMKRFPFVKFNSVDTFMLRFLKPIQIVDRVSIVVAKYSTH